jgi:hypothetical protein
MIAQMGQVTSYEGLDALVGAAFDKSEVCKRSTGDDDTPKKTAELARGSGGRFVTARPKSTRRAKPVSEVSPNSIAP